MPKQLAALVIILIISLPAIAQAPASTSQFPPAVTRGPANPGTQAAPVPPSAKHTITVKFDYDFDRTSACSAKVTTHCVQQFNVYDVSGGLPNKVKLFSIPAPPSARGLVQGITGTSPLLAFELGKHFIAVSAQTPGGEESSPAMCQTFVQVKP